MGARRRKGDERAPRRVQKPHAYRARRQHKVGSKNGKRSADRRRRHRTYEIMKKHKKSAAY